jgi:SHS2 domain-containing protein
VGSFAVVAGGPGRTARRHATVGSDEDLLVAVVDEVIYWLDAEGEVPVSVAVRRAGKGGVDLVLPLAAVSAMGIIGAAPKAASLHDLRCAPDPAGQWSRSVTIDVQDMARWL